MTIAAITGKINPITFNQARRNNKELLEWSNKLITSIKVLYTIYIKEQKNLFGSPRRPREKYLLVTSKHSLSHNVRNMYDQRIFILRILGH